MTTKRILFERPDGGVSVLIPDPDYVQSLMAGGMTENQAVNAVKAKDVPVDAVKVEIMEAADLPSRESRDAWRLA